MKSEMQKLRHPYVGTEHLLLAILHDDKLEITKELSKFNLNYDRFRNEIIEVIGVGTKCNDVFLYTALLKRVIENSSFDCRDNNECVDVKNLFLSLLDEGEGVANRILLGMNIDIDFLYEKFSDNNYIDGNSTNKLLSEYGCNLNKKFIEFGFDPVIGRDDYVNRLIEILLRRTKNNPVLVGDAGVGKSAIVEELVRRIEKGMVPRKLLGTNIVSISMSSLIAGTKYRGEFEERINQIIQEVEGNDKIIIFIDEIHTLVGAGGAEGAIDASNILKPYLARGTIRIIGATTLEEYSKYIEGDKALDRRFQKIKVLEMSEEETKNILFNIRDIYENYHNVKISDAIVEKIISLSSRYIHTGKFPDKAIDIFDEVCARTSMIDNDYDNRIRDIRKDISFVKDRKYNYISAQDFKKASFYRNKQHILESELDKLKEMASFNYKFVEMDCVFQIIHSRTNIPIEILNGFNSKYLYDKLSSVILGQNSIIKDLLHSLELFYKSDSVKPFTSLFVGKSGVGKTFLAQEVSKLLADSSSFVKLDMREFGDDFSISKIVGSPPGYVGYKETRTLLEKVKRNPYMIILLDDIDKCSSKVMNLFVKIFNDGYLSDFSGDEVDFRHVTFLLTTNYCGGNCIGFSKNKDFEVDKLYNIFGEEFISKMNKILFFNELDSKIINKIVINKLCEKKISTKFVEKIINDSNYKKYGARKVEELVNSLYFEKEKV